MSLKFEVFLNLVYNYKKWKGKINYVFGKFKRKNL